MPQITVTRTARLWRGNMGGGQSGKMTTGLISANWGFAGLSIKAGSLGLSSIDRVYLSPGTLGPGGSAGTLSPSYDLAAAVNSRGSPGNSVSIQALMKQSIKVGSITTTRSYVVFSPAFTGTPHVLIQLGSPNGTVSAGSPPSIAYVQNFLSGSVAVRRLGGSPIANRNNKVLAIGPGSFPLYYTAIGD